MKVIRIKRVSINDSTELLRDFYLTIFGIKVNHLAFCRWLRDPKAAGHKLNWNTKNRRWIKKIGKNKCWARRSASYVETLHIAQPSERFLDLVNHYDSQKLKVFTFKQENKPETIGEHRSYVRIIGEDTGPAVVKIDATGIPKLDN